MDQIICDIIDLKANNVIYNSKQINAITQYIIDGSMKDSQLGALLMAIKLNGMTREETINLTKSMRDSGTCFSWPEDWIVGDKHSTGGVGDKVSIALAPALAANGLKVPMISGRSLGHTGGTLDKLESIPGYRVDQNVDEIKCILEEVGCCIVGQTASIVPADKRMYATRDISATTSSLPLIVSSIISKKAAEGLNGLVLDVKCGSGSSFRKDQAENFARELVSAAEGLDVPCTALITDMDSPLGAKVGHALEIEEAIDCLRNAGPKDLEEIVISLGGELLKSTGLVSTLDDGCQAIKSSLRNGSALQTFSNMIQKQGVCKEDAEKLCDSNADYSVLPRVESVSHLYPSTTGYISGIDSLKIAKSCQLLQKPSGKSLKIDHSTGVNILKNVGDFVTPEQPWIAVHHNRKLESEEFKLIQSSLSVQENPVKIVSKVLKRITSDDI